MSSWKKLAYIQSGLHHTHTDSQFLIVDLAVVDGALRFNAGFSYAVPIPPTLAKAQAAIFDKVARLK